MADLKALHQQALDQFKLVVDTEKDQREREQEDLRFDAGDQWPDEVKQARQGLAAGQGQPAVPARPMITIRTLDQPTAQIINQARNARFAIKISPKADTDQEQADVRQGLIRAIEYTSHAQTAYLWAYVRAVVCGRGYFRINKAWAHDDPDDLSGDPSAWDQDLKIEMILNGASVYLDPWAQALNDPAAAQWGMITQDIPEADYKRDYGDTKLASMSDADLTAIGDQKDVWIKTGENGERSFRIAERFFTVYDTRIETNPTNPDQRREVKTRKVMWGKLNGVEWIDEPQEWDGKFIPIIPVVGNEKNIGGKRLWEGIVRPNLGPCRMINYLVSSDAENMGTVTKAPWIGVKGQFEGFEDQWRQPGRLQPWAEYNAMTDETGQNLLPAPQRNIPAVPVSNEAVGMYVNFVRSTTGVPDAALGHVNANDKSGKAIAQLQQASEQGTSNFPDNLQRAIQHAGVVLLDLLPHIYDRPGRIVQILSGQDDERSTVMLNQPFVRQQGQPMPAPPGAQPGQTLPPQPGQQVPPTVEHYDLSQGQFSVVVEVGKSFATRRQAALDGMSALAQAIPQDVPKFADLWVKSMDLPESEAIADRLKPPGTDENIPPQLKVMIGGMQQQLEQAKQIIQTKQVESQARLQEAQLQAQAKLQEAQMDNASRERIAMINTSAQVGIAGAKIDAENARTFVDALEQRWGKALELHMDAVHKSIDRIHALHGQQQAQAHDAGMAALDHSHALLQAQHAADIAPPPLAETENSAQNSEPTA